MDGCQRFTSHSGATWYLWQIPLETVADLYSFTPKEQQGILGVTHFFPFWHTFIFSWGVTPETRIGFDFKRVYDVGADVEKTGHNRIIKAIRVIKRQVKLRAYWLWETVWGRRREETGRNSQRESQLIMVSFYKPGAASSSSSAEVTHFPCLLNHGCRNTDIRANC